MYVTGNVYYTSTNLKEWSEGKTAVIIEPTDEKTNGVDMRNLCNRNGNYCWAPEVYKIGEKYYLFQSYIYWGGAGYPYSSDSRGWVGVAVTDDLSKGFKYVGEIDGLSEMIFNIPGNNTGFNHIDGTLLIDLDNNGNLYTDSNGNFYFYFKAELNSPGEGISQDIYGVKLLKNGDNFTAVGNLQYILGKNSYEEDNFGNDVAEGPQVWKENGYFHMLYSSGDFKGLSDGVYALGYAWGEAGDPLLTTWHNQSTDNKKAFFTGDKSTIYAPGHNALFTKTIKEYYNVYHSAYYLNGIYQTRKVDIQRMGYSYDGTSYTNAPTNAIQPLISGTKYNGKYYYQLNDISNATANSLDDFKISISSGDDVRKLTDGAIYGAMSSDTNFKAGSTTVNTINLEFASSSDISDIWIASDGTDLSGITVTLSIENDYNAYSYVKSLGDSDVLGVAYYKKLQLPYNYIYGGVKKITINFDKPVNLTETTPVRACSTVDCTDKYMYTIGYNSNGGSNVSGTMKIFGNPLGELPTPTGEKVTSETIVSSSVTYIAHWTKESYTILFNGNGGNTPSAIEREYGSKLGELPTPTREGHIFAGWYTESGEEVTSETIVSGSVTYIARWIANVNASKVYKLIVKYLEYDTDNEIAPALEKEVLYGSDYTTSPLAENLDGYELKILPDNYKGKITSETTYVVYYYEKKNPNISSTISQTGPDTISDINEPINYKIVYDTKISDYIGNVKVIIVNKLQYSIDVSKSDLAGGIYDENTKTITWNNTWDITDINNVTKRYSYAISLVYKNIDSSQIKSTVDVKTIINNVDDVSSSNDKVAVHILDVSNKTNDSSNNNEEIDEKDNLLVGIVIIFVSVIISLIVIYRVLKKYKTRNNY